MAQKTVLITGGNKGIGLELSRKFIRRGGYRVVVVARDFKDFTLKLIQDVECVRFDLTDIAAIPAMIAQVGEIDILINNAGMMHALPYNDYPEEKKEQIIKLNLEAPVALIREVAPQMIEKGKGRIVNNASIAGQIGHPDLWYGITKAGMINMTKSFAKILGPQGVVVNAVAAGPVDTEMLAIIPEARKKAIKEAVFTGRFARADEVAEAMFWLATDSPEYINGTCIDINNGAFPR
ncbi:MAG: SDR family oxidoreductase [Desulfobulbaceae bacterium]|nr:SDR family oxidoreductase [Desulfobulbaceae bacterium]HIJ79743.1 SDR family oxidoreductase [Deltaproteobacteria bacterium]